MRSSRTFRSPLFVLLVTASAACAGGERPQVVLAPQPAQEPVVEAEPAPETAPKPERPPEPPIPDRWQAPFAVSSVGRVQARPVRPVAVVPTAGTASTTAMAQESGARSPAATTGPSASAPVPTAGNTSASGAPTSSARTGTAGSTSPARPASEGDPASPRPAQGPRPRTYRVEPGDSWLRIAINHGVSYSQLAAANPGVDPDRIRIGQILQIPQEGAPQNRRSHRVGPGDTLWGIARRYDVSPEALRAANDLDNDRIRQGQVLIIPQPD